MLKSVKVLNLKLLPERLFIERFAGSFVLNNQIEKRETNFL